MLALLLVLPLAGCAGGPEPVTYTGSLSVLESPEHGPQLCSGMNFSNPPSCEGPDVLGWDWSAVRHDSKDGTRWGDYRVTGTWDGSRLTLTEPPAEPDRGGPAPPEPGSPCPVPEGGWRPVDPAKANQRAVQATKRRLMNAPDVGGAWFDHPAGDAAVTVLNVRFTGDLAGKEAWIRRSWGGALCVTRSVRGEKSLRQIQSELSSSLRGRFTSISVDVVKERVELGVWVADEALRRELDGRYGKGVVVLFGALRPVR